MNANSSIHLASTHFAFDTRIFKKECRTLAAAGYRVVFIVPHDRDEVIEGIRVKSVPIPADGRERWRRTLGLIYGSALQEDPNAVYHVHDAELLLHALLLKRRGRKVVYDAHEDTPKQIRYQHWIPEPFRSPLAHTMRVIEWAAGRWFDGIIAAEPGIMRRFPAERTTLVRNFPRLDEFAASERVPYAERPPRVTYVGSITEVRGIREMLEAMSLLPASVPAELALGGYYYPHELAEDVRRMNGNDRMNYLGWLSRPQVAEMLAQSRAGIVTIHPTPKYLESYPTKLFEYMAAGLPVIASDFPAWRPFIQESNCGLLVDPLDPNAIADAIRWVLDHPEEAEEMGKRGEKVVRERYNWSIEAPKLRACYDALFQTHR